ncbi:MAG: hypothetical protein ABW118_08470 [Candidatus Thiodiazotropha sp.]
MILECVTDLLYFGDLESCNAANHKIFAVVHACKDPCHRHAVGYSNKSLHKTHPAYLSYETDNQLFLNLIDPPIPLFQIESFKTFLDFSSRATAQGRPVLIHCNQGQSRAPSLALLYMAKGLNLLPNENYAAARTVFETKFPYTPGKGIAKFLADNWNTLV